LLEEMQAKGVEPDVITYNAAISACEKGGQWEKALQLLEEMQAKGVEPDVITYSATISACEKGGQWEKALQLLEEMRAKGLKPDVITSAAVIDAVVDQLAVARGLLKKALALGFFAKPVRTSVSSWKLDLHEHPEASAVTAVRWWFEEDIHPWLSEQPSSVYPDVTAELITGWGKHREAEQTGNTTTRQWRRR
jgi:pentatricopeptide repeat protein